MSKFLAALCLACVFCMPSAYADIKNGTRVDGFTVTGSMFQSPSCTVFTWQNKLFMWCDKSSGTGALVQIVDSPTAQELIFPGGNPRIGTPDLVSPSPDPSKQWK